MNNEDLTVGDARFKVWPTNANQAAFRSVVSPEVEVGADDPANTIHEAFAFFQQAARAWTRRDHPADADVVARFDELRVAITGLLSVVSINLEDGDNAQVIFETLNARGTPLLAMDLVKNALFYRAAAADVDTDRLHAEIWHPELGDDYWRVEQRQGRLKRPRAELFLMHWLAMKLGRIIPATELFSEFRSHVLDKTPAADVETLLQELCTDAAVMRSFDAQPAGSPEARFFSTLSALDTTTVLPLALWLFRTPTVSIEQRRRALSAVESWLVRRMLCGLTSKNYNKTGAELLTAVATDPDEADACIIRELATATAVTDVWPTNDAVTRAVVTRPLYGAIPQVRLVMILSAIELDRRLANNKVESVFTLPPKLTIEHLLPQKWREHWPAIDTSGERTPEELETARDAVLHRLGNLTLTSGSLNSSLSNSEWPVKGPELRKHSLLMLNAEVAELPHLDVDQINARGFSLAGELCALWPSPAELSSGQDDVDISLDEILAEAANVASATAGAGRVFLGGLVDTGYLEEGETLFPARSGVHANVVVLRDGRLESGGRVFDSPSAAATHCAGTNAENGWTFWLAERDEELVSLKDIRTQYLSATGDDAGGDRHQLRHAFWAGLLDVLNPETPLFASVSPSTDSWIQAGAGFSGVHYWFNVKREACGAYLYLESPSAERNRAILAALQAHRDAIEAAFGGPLVWDEKPGRKRCSIGVALPGGYGDPTESWVETQTRLTEAMVSLAGAIGPLLASVVPSAPGAVAEPPEAFRELTERMDAFAADRGLTIKTSRAGRNYEPRDPVSGVKYTTGIGIYTSSRGAECNVMIFREKGRDDLADDILRRVGGLTGTVPTASQWPSFPWEVLAADWDRARDLLIEPYFAARDQIAE